MAARSPLRYLAPVALVLVALAIALVVTSNGGSDKSNKPAHTVTQRHVPRRRTYVVKQGDTLLAISGKTGVPQARLIALNPGLDPQALQPGQRIKLRP